jgi:hypothetical protein
MDMTMNIKEDKGNGIGEGLLITLLLTVFALALPLTAGADQLQQQLRQAVTDGYQVQDRDRIIGRLDECVQSGIPQETLTPMIRQAARNGIDAEHLDKMLQEMTQARLSDLPAGPLAAKAMEGMVKQVEARNVIRAMERVRERMEFASQQMKRLDGLALSKQERNQGIIGTADAEAAGMERDHISHVYGELSKEAARGRSETAMKKQVMAIVKSMKRIRGYGVPSERVAAICREMIQHQYTEKEMELVMREFGMARSRNRNMETTSRSIESFISDGGRGKDMGSMGSGSESGSPKSSGGGMEGDGNGGSGGMGGGMSSGGSSGERNNGGGHR